MRLEGRLTRDGRWWLAEIPMLNALTQGRTRREALEMIVDWVEVMVNREGFKAEAHLQKPNDFEISGNSAAAITALLLRRTREASGMSLRDLAARLGSSSPNAFARYERGEAVPTLEKLDELLRTASSGRDFVIRESRGD